MMRNYSICDLLTLNKGAAAALAQYPPKKLKIRHGLGGAAGGGGGGCSRFADGLVSSPGAYLPMSVDAGAMLRGLSKVSEMAAAEQPARGLAQALSQPAPAPAAPSAVEAGLMHLSTTRPLSCP
jgi:hypothetical protein